MFSPCARREKTPTHPHTVHSQCFSPRLARLFSGGAAKVTKGPLGDHGHDRAGEKCRKIGDFSQPQGRPRGPKDPLGPVGEKVTLHACLFFWSLPLDAWDKKSYFGKKAVVYRSRFLADPKFFDFDPPTYAPTHPRTHSPTHTLPTYLHTSRLQARSGKARTQRGKMRNLKMLRLQRGFFPRSTYTPTHLHTYTPLAFTHAAENTH